MWVFREGRNFSALLNFDALDVAFQRARKVFKLCVLGCARCGFSETEGNFQPF